MVGHTNRAGSLLGAIVVLLAASCGAPELTYRQDQPDAGPDAVIDAAADAPLDVSADTPADTTVAPDSPDDVNPADQQSDHPADQQSETAAPDASDAAADDVASDVTQEAADDAPADSPDDVPADTLDAPDDAALDQQADSPSDAPPDAPQTCPVGMADVPRANSTTYCVDATEVRAQDYDAWLASSPTTAGQPAACAGNMDFTPSSSQNGCTTSTWDPAGHPERPVVCVDWCDAFAYCAAQGKRLCGDVGGGSVATNKYKNPTANQWFRACSQAGTVSYPYGNTFVATTCNGAGYGANTTVAAGSAAGCVGGYPGLHDMSGNVQEWEDSCNGTLQTSSCRVRGGGFTDGITALRCDADRTVSRLSYASNLGFRCCGQ